MVQNDSCLFAFLKIKQCNTYLTILNFTASIDEFVRNHMIYERNKRMASRVVNMLVQHPRTSFFFALGAAHFIGENTVLDYVESAGFTVKHIAPNETLPE